jgi:hypothetical protein
MPAKLAILAACLFFASCSRVAELPKIPPAGLVELSSGIYELSEPIAVPAGASGLVIRGQGRATTLRAADDFKGSALIEIRDAANVTIEGVTLDGNRDALARPAGLPPSDVPFIDFTQSNGIAANAVTGLEIRDVAFREIAGFAILAARCNSVRVENVHVTDSGSRNELGRNNTTGGILFEGGTADFSVTRSTFDRVLGNGIWTHSLYTSSRNRDGLVSGNRFREIARDAIQAGHATGIRVESNTGTRIGYPVEAVDVEGGGIPVAIDTAGNVDKSVYARNTFEEINGKCIDLDGFHNGEVTGNTCINSKPPSEYPFGHYGIVMNNTNPDMQSENIRVEGNHIEGMKFGGIFIIGEGHVVTGNHFLNVNTAGCNENAARFGCTHFPGEPDLLQSGIYLGQRAERPAVARDNLIEENIVTGHRMAMRCIGFAPKVSPEENRIRENECSNEIEVQ